MICMKRISILTVLSTLAVVASGCGGSSAPETAAPADAPPEAPPVEAEPKDTATDAAAENIEPPEWLESSGDLPIPPERVVVVETSETSEASRATDIAAARSIIIDFLNAVARRDDEKVGDVGAGEPRALYKYLIENMGEYWMQIAILSKDDERAAQVSFYHNAFADDPEEFRAKLSAGQGVVALEGGPTVWRITLSLTNKEVHSSQFSAGK
jgi:hypothetical protein